MDKFEIILLVFLLWNFFGFFVWAWCSITMTNGNEIIVSPNALDRYLFGSHGYSRFKCWAVSILINLVCPLAFVFTFLYWWYTVLKKKIKEKKE